MQEIKNIINKFKEKKILVIGDIMADKYIHGKVERISPEAPVQIVKVSKENVLPGGAANLANNFVSLDAEVTLIGSIGNDLAGEHLLSLLKKQGIDCSNVIIDNIKQTINKVRILGQSQQLLRLDYEDSNPINSTIEKKIIDSFTHSLAAADVVVFSDYNKGTLTEKIIPTLVSLALKANKLIIADTKKSNYLLYNGVDLITPNHKEASDMTGVINENDEDIVNMGTEMSKNLQANVLITRASEGMSLFKKDGEIMHFPTEAKEVYDVSGAGDTVVALMTLALSSGANYQDAVLIASQAAAIQVGKLGTATVGSKELLKRYELEQTKIKERNDAINIVSELKKENKKVVFTSGCFDLLHVGHIKLLKDAAAQGDVLVIGLNTDESVRKLKGESRPVIKQEQRAEMLSFLDFVDLVTFFDEDTPEKIISELKPDVFIKGGDYEANDLPEAETVKSYGGKIVILPLSEGFSSSTIIERILNKNN